MIPNKKITILVLAPHTDDAEISCGGTIARLIEEKQTVYHVAFSSAANIVRDGMIRQELLTEIMKSNAILGVPEENIFIHEFNVREFQNSRQDILNLLIHYRNKLKPDMVLVPSLNDNHQDHQVIVREAIRAFKYSTILSYENACNNLNFDLDLYVELTQEQLSKKLSACAQFISQSGKRYFDPKNIKALAMTRGLQSDNDFAEVFEVIRINL